MERALSPEETASMDAWWRAANYLSVGQIYLLGNPLLKEPLRKEHIKPRLLGHWGTTPGLNFIHVHLNRLIKKHDLDMIEILGPGHGGPAAVANAYLEGTYTEVYPEITMDEKGMRKLFKQFSFPGGIPSHAAPETPGSMHEGGELGYALSHAFGAAFDNPDLLVACIIGDGEAETGPLAGAWHGNKFLNPARDGVVLPILHLNGYKIAGPTVLSRIPRSELESLLRGYGYEPFFVEGGDLPGMHERMAATLDQIAERIAAIRKEARSGGPVTRPNWPALVFTTPKGWSGPKEVDGKQTEGTWRSHQVPMGEMDKPGHLEILEGWMKSYRPWELFDESGRFRREFMDLSPQGNRRMTANPHANGGLLMKDLNLPDFRGYALKFGEPATIRGEATRVQGAFIRDVIRMNPDNFRVVSPDETASNRWGDVFQVTQRVWMGEILPSDENLSRDGRVMEILSEHQCQGWLEGYLLTGRHGFFSCYEAFIHVVDSMFNQHAKWLQACKHIPWRRSIPSLNILLTSHVWRQDHNGFSHQDPGFLDVVCNKSPLVTRIYLPPDANCLLSVTNHCLTSRDKVNVVVAGKQPSLQYLNMEEADRHCIAGASVWEWAGNAEGAEPDVVLACCGDVPTLEILAASDLLQAQLPELKVRVVNVVDLMKLPQEHPHSLPDGEFDALFTKDKPVIFAFHGYPWLIHRLVYRRTNHVNFHVRGFKEQGTTTTPFDMTVLNDMDRFRLVMDVLDRVPGLAGTYPHVRQAMVAKRAAHREYVVRNGDDMPEVKQWKWSRLLVDSLQEQS
ncbi:MAG TPA: phosphoketolase family protein [Fibrobacteria bacterium]|nr:phosphoketolase family protein [Fibrobacteria bacterium]